MKPSEEDRSEVGGAEDLTLLLRSGLEADRDTVERVKRAALGTRVTEAAGGSRSSPRPLRWALGLGVVGLAVVLGLLAPLSRPGALPVEVAEESSAPREVAGAAFSVSNKTGALVVRRADGVIAIIDRGGS